MERTIRVTGKGNISVKPDMVRLNITLKDANKSYGKMLETSAAQTEILKDCFEKVDFERNDLKTLYFDVNTEYESYQNKNKEWKQKFKGYSFTHRLKIEFPSDNERLGRALYELAHCSVEPEFSLSYTVKNVEECKNQLLGVAVADSRRKAEILTQASGTKLGEVINIDYSWGQMEIVSNITGGMMNPCTDGLVCEGESYDINIEPDDIDVTDSVTVVWGLG